jgi:tRNA dimethylallyltransferase
MLKDAETGRAAPRPCLSQGRRPAASRRWRSRSPKLRTASSSIPIPCRSIGLADHHRATDAGGRSAGAAPALWHRAMPPSIVPLGSWVTDAAHCALAEATGGRDGLPIFIGGTGTLFQGADPRPVERSADPAEVREQACVRAWSAMASRPCMRSLRGATPPRSETEAPRQRARRPCARGDRGDGARAAGLAWRGPAAAAEPDGVKAIFLAPDRKELYARIDGALESRRAMMGAGRAQARSDAAAMKAHDRSGILIRHLAGEITLEQAVYTGQIDTRHYAKRQYTWFRHQLPEFEWVAPDEAVSRFRRLL